MVLRGFLVDGKTDAAVRSVDLYLDPTAPKGKEGNWVQTVPGKGWWGIFFGNVPPNLTRTSLTTHNLALQSFCWILCRNGLLYRRE